MKRTFFNRPAVMLLMASFLAMPVSCIEVESKPKVVVEAPQDQPEPYSFEDPSLEYLPAYFDDEQFDYFYKTCVERYENGEPAAIYDLHSLFLSRCITNKQIHTALDNGYLTEYLDLYKASKIIEQDYTLPEDVTIHETPELKEEVPEASYEESYMDYEDMTQTYVHNVTETASIDAQRIMVELMQDNVRNNAYIHCPVDSPDKRIFGQMLEISALRSEPLIIAFLDEELGQAAYTWIFSKQLYINRDYLDLTVKYDGKSLDFDLQNTLPRAAKLSIYTGEPAGTTVLLKEHDGTIAYTLEVDRDGYITLDQVYDKGSYNIACQYIQTETEDDAKDDSVSKQESKQLQEVPQVSNVGLIVVVILLITLGSVLMVLAITSHQTSKKPTKKH